MKKEFETPEINVMMFDVEDVITTSYPNGNDNENEGEGQGGEGEFPIG